MPANRKRQKVTKDTQAEAFIEAAKDLGCDESEAHFDAALKKVARHKPTATVNGQKEVKPHERDGTED
jgi:hypothetical protein